MNLRAAFTTTTQLALALVLACACLPGCAERPAPPAAPPPALARASRPPRPTLDPHDMERIGNKVALFCGACHAVPPVDAVPRADWLHEVARGYQFYELSGRTDLEVPDREEVTAWFEAQAPEELHLPKNYNQSLASPVQFRREDLTRSGPLPFFSAVCNVRWLKMAGSDPAIFYCDAESQEIWKAQLTDSGERKTTLFAPSNYPCQLELCDLNQDGHLDVLVAELGNFVFGSSDHNLGQVVWLRGSSDPDQFTPIVLAKDFGRVADVQPGDFNEDGKLDLVVGEFGFHETGSITLLLQTEIENGIPQFERRKLDSRHGTIHVPVLDLNGDGHLDFVALVSQDHEQIDAFLGRGDGTFEVQTIHEAGNPAYGSTGIQLVDFDGDGDRDVLYTNGDSMDTLVAKPYHGIHLLENTGSFPFQHHLLAIMPGVHRALAGDLDGDGDLDVAACAVLPERLYEERPSEFDSLLWLEQISPNQFARHTLERGDCHHSTLELADFDGDGDLDLALGNLGIMARQSPSDLSIWWNEGPSTPGSGTPEGSEQLTRRK